MKLLTLAERMKFARNRKNLTQERLAQLAGTSQDVINKIEIGKSLRPRNIEKLAAILDVSPAWLQFGEEQFDKVDSDAVEIAIDYSTLSPEQKTAIKTLINSLKRDSK